MAEMYLQNGEALGFDQGNEDLVIATGRRSEQIRHCD